MGVLDDLKQAKEEARNVAAGLPAGSAPVDAAPEEPAADSAAVEAPAPEAAVGGEEAAAVAEPPKEVKKIKIAGREFDSEEEAFAYADELEKERLLEAARAEGMREALEYQRAQANPAPAAQEDDFEARYYTDPKSVIEEMKERAKAEIRQELSAKEAEEQAWREFSEEYPDLADSRRDVMRILQENWDVLGKMKDRDKAKKLLAQKTRSYYDRIVEMRAPRRELPKTATQAVSPSGGAPRSVTQAKKEEAPLTMAEQLRSLRVR